MTLRELFSSEDRWTQNSFARDKNGMPVPCCGTAARCWCLIGGILCVYGENAYKVINKIYKHTGMSEDHLSTWNDSAERTYEDVVKLCRELNI